MFITMVLVSNNRNNKNNTICSWPVEQGLSTGAQDKGSATYLPITRKIDMKCDLL